MMIYFLILLSNSVRNFYFAKQTNQMMVQWSILSSQVSDSIFTQHDAQRCQMNTNHIDNDDDDSEVDHDDNDDDDSEVDDDDDDALID